VVLVGQVVRGQPGTWRDQRAALGFAPQQPGAGHERTLDAFAGWRGERNVQLRVGLANLLAPRSATSNSVADIDGFSAGSRTQRKTPRVVNLSWVQRF